MTNNRKLNFKKKLYFKRKIALYKKVALYKARFLFCVESYPIYIFNKMFPCLFKLRIKQNNVFANLSDISNSSNVLKFWSCGLQKLKASKRKLKFVLNILLKVIFRKLKNFSRCLISIRGPRYLQKFCLKKVLKARFVKPLIVLESVKIFNGCRARKKRRKKYRNQKFRALK